MKWATAAAAVLALAAIIVWRVEAASAQRLAMRFAKPAAPLAVTPDASMAADGERLAKLDGCTGCHGKALTGTLIFSGPFGTRLAAPNLTALAHRHSDAQLATAIRYGIKPDGTSLVGMPTGKFLRSSDSDIAAIIAYLKSLPQKPDATGKTQWGFGGRALLAMGLMPLTANAADPWTRGPRQTPTEPMARGRYLTEVHCTGCHGPELGGNPEEDSPDLRFSIKHYSPAAFARFFRTGQGRIGHGTETMTPLIKERLHNLTEADVQAIYLYLKNSRG